MNTRNDEIDNFSKKIISYTFQLPGVVFGVAGLRVAGLWVAGLQVAGFWIIGIRAASS